MSADNLPQYTSPAEPIETDNGTEHVKIRFCIFFDGTCNNRVNTQGRLDNSEAYQKFKKKSDSYENDFTNVAKMEPHVDVGIPPSGYHHMLRTYIEGPGTTDNEKDSMVGYGIGMGVSGVREKVKKGLADVVTKIDKKLDENNKIVIDLLTLDVFGFSRGAAGARSFIHAALAEKNDTSIKASLKDKGYAVGQVEVCFAGLYDTVSSHGVNFSNDTKTLNLDAVSDAQAVLHLVAADEHREKFSLTDIQSAAGKGREVYLPGAHSDVGGSYNDATPEDHVLYEGPAVATAAADRNYFIHAGWGTAEEIRFTDFSSPEQDHARLAVTRAAISNHYSKIALNLMAKYAREKGIVFDNQFAFKVKLPSQFPELTTAQEKIDAYVEGALSRASWKEQTAYWLNNKENWLKDLRRRHLHFSAKYAFGLKPRFKNGKRFRQIYNG